MLLFWTGDQVRTFSSMTSGPLMPPMVLYRTRGVTRIMRGSRSSPLAMAANDEAAVYNGWWPISSRRGVLKSGRAWCGGGRQRRAGQLGARGVVWTGAGLLSQYRVVCGWSVRGGQPGGHRQKLEVRARSSTPSHASPYLASPT